VPAARGGRRVPDTAFARPRLLARLDAAGDVAVVLGPAGSGKTTLLAAWAAAHGDAPAVWHEVESAEDLPGVLGASGLLVVDRAERLGDEALRRIGAELDRTPGLRLAIATRSSRVPRVLGLATDAAIEVIGPQELLVDAEELAAATPGLAEAARARVLEEAGGLTVGVRAAIEGDEERLRARFRDRLLESLDGRPPGVREALLRLSLVELADAAILAAFDGPPETFEAAEELGLGSLAAGWLRISPFAREVLAPVVAELPEEERRRLVRLAVRTSLMRDQPLAALRAALGIEDLGLATDVALSGWIPLVEHGPPTYRALAAVPRSRLSAHPPLVVMLAMLANLESNMRLHALQLMASAAIRLRALPARGSRRDRAVYRAFEAAALRLTPFADQALGLVRKAWDELEALSPEAFESIGRLGPELYSHLGLSAMYGGDVELADRCFQIGYAKHSERGWADAADPLALRGGLAAILGDLPKARRLLAEADAMEWPPGWREGTPGCFLHLGLAAVALDAGDPAVAQEQLDAVGPFTELVEHWSLFAAIQARLDLRMGDPHGGLQRLKRLRERRRSGPMTAVSRGLFDAAEAELLLGAGDVVRATQLAARAARDSAVGALVLARAQLAAGNEVAALAAAQRALRDQARAPRVALEAELVVVANALRHRRLDDAAVVIARIDDIVATSGLRGAFAALGVTEREALIEAARGLGRDRLAEVVESVPSAALPNRVPALTERELAVLAALVETGVTAEIADRLFVSPNTVKSQMRTLYRKLGVHTREAALVRAVAVGYLTRR